MHMVRHDVIEQALVMGDDDHGAVGRAQRVDAIGHDAQRIDVEAGIGFIEHAERGLEHRHLQDFGALLFAAGEADIDRALQHVLADVQLGGAFLHQAHEIRRGQFLFATRLALGVQRHFQELHGGNAGNFDGILEGEEHALGGAVRSGAMASRSSPL